MAETDPDRYLANDACLVQYPEQWRRFMHALRSMLEEERPVGIRPTDTVLCTLGGAELWAILPHRALDGTSIGCAISCGNIYVLWTRAIRLGPWYDALEMSRAPGDRSAFTVPEKAIDAALQLVRGELDRPIKLTIHDGLLSRRRLLARIRIPHDTQRDIMLGSVRDPDAPWWDRLAGRQVDQIKTSMRDDSELPIARRPRVERWNVSR